MRCMLGEILTPAGRGMDIWLGAQIDILEVDSDGPVGQEIQDISRILIELIQVDLHSASPLPNLSQQHPKRAKKVHYGFDDLPIGDASNVRLLFRLPVDLHVVSIGRDDNNGETECRHNDSGPTEIGNACDAWSSRIMCIADDAEKGGGKCE